MNIITLQDAQDLLHVQYEMSDTNTPAVGSDDYNLRTKLFNKSIDMWMSKAKWRQLYTRIQDAADGDKTIQVGTITGNGQFATAACPSNFIENTNFVRVNYANQAVRTFKFIPPEKVSLYVNDTVTPYYYVTGHYNGVVGACVIHLQNGAFVGGETLDYPYYKQATKMSSPTDIFDMADPNYAVLRVLSKLHEADTADSRATQANMDAKDVMDMMIIFNEEVPYFQDGTPESDNPFVAGFGQ
jgi:hypothetical protein